MIAMKSASVIRAAALRRRRAAGEAVRQPLRPGCRCCSAVPEQHAEHGGDADERGSAGLDVAVERVRDRARPATRRGSRPSEVAAARRWSKREQKTSSGTITMPPPTPNSAPKKPARAADPDELRRPVGTSRTLRRWMRSPDLTAEPERAALFLDVDGVLAPIVERPEDARVPAETRARAPPPGRALRPRRLRHRPAERRRARDRRRRRAGLRRRARAGARPGGRGAGPTGSTRSRASVRMAGHRDEAALGRLPLPARADHETARESPSTRSQQPRPRRASGRVGPHGARGRSRRSTPPREPPSAHLLDEQRPRPRALRRRRHHRPRRLRGARRAGGGRARRGRLDRRARPSSASAPTSSSVDRRASRPAGAALGLEAEPLAHLRAWRRATSSSVFSRVGELQAHPVRRDAADADDLRRLTRYERWMRAKRPAGSFSSSSPSDAVQRYERS